MKPITTIMAEIDQTASEKLEEVITKNKNFNVLGTTRNGSTLMELIRQHEPELVILSKNIQDKQNDGLELCRLIVGEFKTTTVIVTSLFEQMSDLRDAMRVGARDFIALPDFDSRLVNSAIELITSNRKYDFTNTDKKGKVISVVSPVDGVGKSTFALNITVELANRMKGKKIALLDYSLQFGDLAYLSSIKSQRTIADLNDISNIDMDVLQAHMVEHPNGFWLLSAPKKPQYADIIRSEILKQTVELLRKNYDYIIIDTAQGLSDATLISVESSDLVLCLTLAELVALKNTKACIEMLDAILEEGTSKDIVKLITTKTDKTSVPTEEIAKRLKYEVIGAIPKNDYVVTQSRNYNKYIVIDQPNTDVGKALKTISDNIEKIFNEDEYYNSTTNKPKETKKGILGSLFGK